MSHLLKNKSKVVKKQKDRVVYKPFDFMKKFKDENGIVKEIEPSQIDTFGMDNVTPSKKIQPKLLEKYEYK